MKSKVTGVLSNWTMSPIHGECSKGIQKMFKRSIGVKIFSTTLVRLSDVNRYYCSNTKKIPEREIMQNLINFYHWQGLGVMPTSLSLSLSAFLVHWHHILSILVFIPCPLVFIVCLIHFQWFSKLMLMIESCGRIFFCYCVS